VTHRSLRSFAQGEQQWGKEAGGLRRKDKTRTSLSRQGKEGTLRLPRKARDKEKKKGTVVREKNGRGVWMFGVRTIRKSHEPRCVDYIGRPGGNSGRLRLAQLTNNGILGKKNSLLGIKTKSISIVVWGKKWVTKGRECTWDKRGRRKRKISPSIPSRKTGQ